MLESALSGQLADTVHQIFAFPVDHLSDIFKFALCHMKPLAYPLNFLVDMAKLFSARVEVMLEVELLLLLRLDILLLAELLQPPFLQLSLLPHQLLFLLQRGLHGLIAPQQLLLHLFEPLECLCCCLLFFLFNGFLSF